MTETLPVAVHKTSKSRLNEVDFQDLKFGKYFSDHMYVADYKDGQWGDLQILPYGPMAFPPSLSALHYGQAIFEGQKAYRTQNGDIQIFRPVDNFLRFNASARRMCMPEISEEIFVGGLVQLIQTDKDWVPSSPGSSLYLRPFMFSTDEFLGVRASETYRFMIITCPVGKYYTEPIKVKVEKHFSRVADGGIGSAKAAGNYAASLYPAKLAQEQGFHQLLWTDAKEHAYFEESGTMNVMFLVDGKLITPSLGNTILDGITRQSVISIAKDMGVKVEERRVSVVEIIEALEKGTLQEAFGAGTAATIAPIALIHHEGVDYNLPELEKRPFATAVYNTLSDIRYGVKPDPYNWMLKV